MVCRHRRTEDGFSLLEVLVVMATIGILVAIAIVAYLGVLKRAHVSYFAAESRSIYNALVQYYQDNERYPSNLDLATLEPLRPIYYDGDTTTRLEGGEFDGYGGPGNGTTAVGGGVATDEFWLELTLDIDPNLRMLVASSDDAPMGGGAWHDGIFLFRDGTIRPLPW